MVLKAEPNGYAPAELVVYGNESTLATARTECYLRTSPVANSTRCHYRT
jgi:hypothetical protein